MKSFDVAVIGGGPGGYVAAIRAAQLGLEVVLIEENHIGGTCLNHGCIPTKALLHSAGLYNDIRNSSSFGVNVRDVSFDYKKMAGQKDAVDKGSSLELLMGESDDLSGLLIDAQKAELSLQLALQIRNKVIDAYNEVMRMSV